MPTAVPTDAENPPAGFPSPWRSAHQLPIIQEGVNAAERGVYCRRVRSAPERERRVSLMKWLHHLI